MCDCPPCTSPGLREYLDENRQFEKYRSSENRDTSTPQTDLQFGEKGTKGGHIAVAQPTKDHMKEQDPSLQNIQLPGNSRKLVIAHIQKLAAKAKVLPQETREARGDYSGQPRKFPQTPGEDIASDISSILAQQDWIDSDREPELEEIGSIAGNLEIDTDDHELWCRLFEKISKLE
jgi:hypothetical protein